MTDRLRQGHGHAPRVLGNDYVQGALDRATLPRAAGTW